MTKTKGPTLRQFQDRFPTEDSCLDHLFQVRYGEDFDCPKCGRPAKYSRVKGRRSYQCQWCANNLYPTAGTPFDRTRTSLRDWFYVMFLFCSTRNGVAAKRVERELGVTYKTAWRMCDQIRKYMSQLDSDARLPEHYGFRAQDADPDLMAALLAADYRHLPEIDVNLK